MPAMWSELPLIVYIGEILSLLLIRRVQSDVIVPIATDSLLQIGLTRNFYCDIIPGDA